MTTQITDSILVHVGFPKALSSWLQKNWFVPENGYLTVMNPVQVQLNLIDPTPFLFKIEDAVTSIETTMQGSGGNMVPVISSEALAGNLFCGGYNGKECIDRISLFAPNARILLIIREQRNLIRSLYKTWINWGMPHSIDHILKPIEPRLVPQFNFDFLRFDQRVTYYQQLFGTDRVKVLAYEMFQENPVDFLSRLADFAKVATDFQSRPRSAPVNHKVNPGRGLSDIYLQRLHNYFFTSGPFTYTGKLRFDATARPRQSAGMKRMISPSFLNAWLEERFARKVLEKTVGQFAESNRRLEKLSGINLKDYGYEV